MSRYSLATLRDRFVADADRLAARLATARAASDLVEEAAAAEYCIVALHDAYSRFVRDLLLRSSIGNAVTAGGSKLGAGSLGVVRLSDALNHLRSSWSSPKPGWWEPRWHLQRDATQVARLLDPPNRAVIIGAIGASTNPNEQLRRVRNFVAHRGPSTSDGADGVAVACGAVNWRQPRDIIRIPIAGTGEVLFDQWCRQLKAVGRAAVV